MKRVSLIDFYRSYAEWLDSGAPSGNPYHRDSGLCDSLKVWYRNQGKGMAGFAPYKYELHDDFIRNDLDSGYPFGMWNFRMRQIDKTMHLCPKRISFVRDRIKEHDEKLAQPPSFLGRGF